MVHFLQVFGSDYVVLLVCSKYSQTFDYVLLGNLAPSSQAFLLCFIGWFVPSSQTFYLCASTVCKRLEQGLENGVGQGFCGLRIYLPFWYVGCQMRLEPVFLIFGKPRGIL